MKVVNQHPDEQVNILGILKPTRRKLLFFVFLFLVVNILSLFINKLIRVVGILSIGTPYPFYDLNCGLDSPPDHHGDFFVCSNYFDAFKFVLDVMLWYVVSVVIERYK